MFAATWRPSTSLFVAQQGSFIDGIFIHTIIHYAGIPWNWIPSQGMASFVPLFFCATANH